MKHFRGTTILLATALAGLAATQAQVRNMEQPQMMPADKTATATADAKAND